MDEVRNEEQQQTHGEAALASDELADKVSAEFTGDQTPTANLPRRAGRTGHARRGKSQRRDRYPN